MPKQRAVDDEMELARLRPPVDSFAPSAIGEQDTSGWFRRYRLTGLGALVAGILLVLLGGMWTLSELTEPGRYVEHRSFPSIDPFCESNNSPFGNSTITFPGALPSAAPCIKYTNIDISRNNTFNRFALYPLAIGFTILITGLLMVSRSFRWRRIAKRSPWTVAHILAVRAERGKDWLAIVQPDDTKDKAVMRFRSTARWRAKQLRPTKVQLLTDGDGEWMMRMPHDRLPFLLWEPRTAKHLHTWHQWDMWAAHATSSTPRPAGRPVVTRTEI